MTQTHGTIYLPTCIDNLHRYIGPNPSNFNRLIDWISHIYTIPSKHLPLFNDDPKCMPLIKTTKRYRQFANNNRNSRRLFRLKRQILLFLRLQRLVASWYALRGACVCVCAPISVYIAICIDRRTDYSFRIPISIDRTGSNVFRNSRVLFLLIRELRQIRAFRF